MTEKLFYKDAYLRRFTAQVTGCEQSGKSWLVTLNRTAFYPEGGGQSADTGVLGGVNVLDVHEKEGVLLHTTDAPLEPGMTAEGEIDWAPRFSRMQQHSGEHIVSGIIHKLFGLDNVGFHMGRDAVTIDLSGELTAADLRRVERLANEAVWADLPLEIAYPTPEELPHIPYRSKKELTGDVRIVTVPGSDICACCGTHVARTGEIGAIKLLAHQRYKGGVRVWLLCGSRALEDYAEKNEAVYEISERLSAKPGEVAAAVKRMAEENEALKFKLVGLQNGLIDGKAAQVSVGTPFAMQVETDMDPAALRRYCLALIERCGVALALCGGEKEGWKYALGSKTRDVRPLGKALNAAFSGRGGGAAELVQGTLNGAQAEIKAFLEERL